MLLSVHSFTPVLGEKKRSFDLGILFNRYEALAQEFGQRLSHTGYRVRYNEPYSGYDGLIFSVRNHGERQQLVYLEIEINNGLLLDRTSIGCNGSQAEPRAEGRISATLKSPQRESNGRTERRTHMRIILIGQAAFASSSLDKLRDKGQDILAVFCPPDRVEGKFDPVKSGQGNSIFPCINIAP